MKQHAYLLLYALVIAVALSAFCAGNQPRPQAPLLATPTARTTLIPPVTTTPRAP